MDITLIVSLLSILTPITLIFVGGMAIYISRAFGRIENMCCNMFEDLHQRIDEISVKVDGLEELENGDFKDGN